MSLSEMDVTSWGNTPLKTRLMLLIFIVHQTVPRLDWFIEQIQASAPKRRGRGDGGVGGLLNSWIESVRLGCVQ